MAQLPVDLGGGGGSKSSPLFHSFHHSYTAYAEGNVTRSEAAYLDTEGTFRPDRIKSIAERAGVDGNLALNNITYARAYNSEQQVTTTSLYFDRGSMQ